MTVGRVCVRIVHFAAPAETVRTAARRMAEVDVGTLVVVDPPTVPVGIVTDRDVMRAVARGLDPDRTNLVAVMSSPVVTIDEDARIEDALERMAGHEVRRLVVTDAKSRLVGILALDDVLDLLSDELATVRKVLARRDRRRPAVAR